MKVLWFEVSTPSGYIKEGPPIGGWQDSLERIVRTIPEIELTIAFISDKYSEVKKNNGVTYVPIHTQWSFVERFLLPYWDIYVNKMLPAAKQIITKFKPDLIHVFGTEWPFGQIAAYTDIPVVIHIMGSIVPYNNANYPPGYSYNDYLLRNWWRPLVLYNLIKMHRDSKNLEVWENSTWKIVRNYMGRTHWDESLSRVMHPSRIYYQVDEALRPQFIKGNKSWSMPQDGKIHLISTGCSSFWKGPDMLLKVAKILANLGVNFKWNVAGAMNPQIKKFIEKKEKITFQECCVNFLGFIQPEELTKILCSSTMYVHTSYIENSPNSICEAQCLGLPVVSTNVGGISTLIRDNVDGILVAANDPWQMADAIIQLNANKSRMQKMSESTMAHARKRHDDNNIKYQLMNCYHSIINSNVNKDNNG